MEDGPGVLSGDALLAAALLDWLLLRYRYHVLNIKGRSNRLRGLGRPTK